MKKPVVYIILDGLGLAPPGKGNAVSLAKTPNMDKLWKTYPHTKIGAGGESIGLWKGHQGSSEIGHFIIGAGRNVHLPQGIVAHAVTSKKIFRNKAYLSAIKYVKKHNSTLHLAGLMSDKGVHNYDITVHALIEMAKKNNVKDVVIHFITDGRDTEPYDSRKYLRRLQKVMKKQKLGKIGTVMGRYWIMDRDHRWKRVEKGYNAIANSKAEFHAKSAREAIENAYKRGFKAKKKRKNFIESDEFIKPTIITDKNDSPIGKIKDKDALIWVNFRTDRAIEITKAFVEPRFNKFKRKKRLDIHYVCTFKYYDNVPAPHAFERIYPKKTFGEIISKAGLKQFRVTETEKWIYVTTVFSGMREKPFPGEKRLLIPSDKIPTYDLKPKMHIIDIANAAVKAINSDKYELIFMNFNNPDIIGHTGNLKAAITGVEECDKGIGLVVDAVRKKNGLTVISADHGNAEVMLTKKGNPHTTHTANKVPFIIVDDDPQYKNCKLRNSGAIKDVTPTILKILGIKKPKEMIGSNLIIS
jgi:2,3-bisphosphoglycerate-independent phosphoglycerate mutase|tara:strand:+ start:1128 stop:2705 length:1578 start_codon:yes stop_codon:yes gene_type:complete